MAITITTIQPQDSLAASRLTLNSNFATIKAGVDSLQSLLDPTTYVLTGVKSATINNAAVSFTTSIFQVGKGSSLLGNVIMGTVGATTSVSIRGTGGVVLTQSSLTLTSGNLVLTSATSTATLGGNLSIGKELRTPGISTAFSAKVGLTAGTTISTAGLKFLVVGNSGPTGPHVATLSAGNTGQVLEIYHSLGASATTVQISTSNFYGLTGGILLTKTGDTLRCIYEGTSWYLMNYSPASFGATSGATASSITFTTL